MEKVSLKLKSSFKSFLEENKKMATLSFVFFVFGVVFTTFIYFVDIGDPGIMSFGIWAGMCLFLFSLTFFIFMAFHPSSPLPQISKVITPILYFGALVGFYFLFRVMLFPNAARYDGDVTTMHIAIISCVATSALLGLLYVIFGITKKGEKAYIISMSFSILAAFLAMFVGNLAKLGILALIIGIVGVVIIGVITLKLYEEFRPADGHTYVTSSGHTLVHLGGKYYKDEEGHTWISDDFGQTAYKTN